MGKKMVSIKVLLVININFKTKPDQKSVKYEFIE